MAEWSRDTPWRQGHLLTPAALSSLVPEASERFDVAVVISHDCDLACDPTKEPNVEVLLGKRISQGNGNFTHAKNARRLHLTFSDTANMLTVDVLATDKAWVEKQKLADFEPETMARLAVAERNILQRWLSSRYRRAAFPNAFEAHMSERGLADKLSKVLKSEGDVIKGMFFDLDDGQEVERSDDNDAYSLHILLLYTEEMPEAFEKAEHVSKGIEKLFRSQFYDGSKRAWSKIELGSCEPISDEAMTIAQAERLKRWNGDHISLRDQQHAIMNDG